MPVYKDLGSPGMLYCRSYGGKQMLVSEGIVGETLPTPDNEQKQRHPLDYVRWGLAFLLAVAALLAASRSYWDGGAKVCRQEAGDTAAISFWWASMSLSSSGAMALILWSKSSCILPLACGLSCCISFCARGTSS